MSKKLSREEVANIEVGNTAISRPLAITIVTLFLAFIMVYPLFQAGYELTNNSGKTLPQSLAIYPQLFRQLTVDHGGDSLIKKVVNTNDDLLKTINDYEDNLEQQAVLRKYLLSPAQSFMLSALKTGNEKAFIGFDGWLFYQSGVSYLTNGGFLQADVMNKRLTKKAGLQPDPRKAIIQFNRQLMERGVKLIIVPMSIKPMLYPEKLAGKQYRLPLNNPSFNSFCEQLTAAGVTVFNPATILVTAKQAGMNVFLKTDTHWTPEAMQLVAKQLAMFIETQVKLQPVEDYAVATTPIKLKGQGDIAEMLNMDNVEQSFPLQEILINEVVVDNSYWRIDKNAEVLLLGDSFSNIYSLKGMGWGAHAGFAEQLSRFLKCPVDAIRRNDAGAYATRQQLANDLKRGYDRLAGKKVVVWEFAARELAEGNWKLLDMKLGQRRVSSFLVPDPKQPIEVEAIVSDISSVPRPGTVPYKDHVMSMHLVSADGSKNYLVYAMSMQDNKLLPIADLRIGATVKLRLSNWQDVEDKYSGLNRSDLDDEDIALEDPCWGELLTTNKK